MPQSASTFRPEFCEVAELELPERMLPALLFSVVFHVVLLTGIGILLSPAPAGTNSEIDRPVGIAIVQRLPDRDRYVDLAKREITTASAESVTEPTSSSAAAMPAAISTPPIDLEGILSELQQMPTARSGTGLAGDATFGEGAFDSKRPSGSDGQSERATTTVFGVTGSGSRFVYVFDRSDSMNGSGGLPLRAAKRELITSLSTLTERQQFQLIFYNQQPKLFQTTGIGRGLMFGEEANVKRAIRFVESITAFGATEHESALQLALQLGPDVIFFLTDARIPRLSASQLSEIRHRAERAGTTIHAIEFGSEPNAPQESFLMDLAAQNNGQYRYVGLDTLESSQLESPQP